MKIAIYQIAIERDENRLAFQSLNHIISVSNGRVPAELYDCVFAGEASVQTLEDIFYVFNMEHPSGYKGRSLSVSDVVEIFLASGESEFYYCEPMQVKKKNGDSTPLYQCLGGTSAEKLARYGRARADGKSLSRTAQLVCGNKTDFLFVADSGPGETNAKGLIVPRFGKNPENHVSVSMTFELFSELMLMTKTHYQSWLTAYYLQNPIKSATLPAQETYAVPDSSPNTLF